MKTKSSLGFYKKGQDVNLLFVAVMVLILAIVIVVGYKVVKQLNSSVQNMGIATQEIKDITQKVENKYVAIWDILFLILLVFIFIIMIASAFFIDTHPLFFIISLVMTSVTAFVGGHIANAYSSFAEDTNIATEASSFVIIPYVFQHYIAILVIMGMVTGIVLFAKLRSASG